MSAVEYTEVEFSGKNIRQRVSDGYLNATDMCKANGKLYGNWYQLYSTKEFLEELSSDIGYPISQLVEVRKGNSKKYKQGTWIHPHVATNLAQWLSPKFAVFVSKLVFRYFSGDMSLVDEIKQNNELLNNQIQQLQEENQKQLQLLEENRQRIEQSQNAHAMLKNYVDNVKQRLKKEIIYIATTRQYANQNNFKIGGCSARKLLHKRLAT